MLMQKNELERQPGVSTGQGASPPKDEALRSLRSLAEVHARMAALDGQRLRLTAELEAQRTAIHVAASALARQRALLTATNGATGDGRHDALARLTRVVRSADEAQAEAIAAFEAALREAESVRSRARAEGLALERHRGELAAALTAGAAAAYQALLAAAVAVPVAFVQDGRCGVCGESAPSHEGLWTCSGCERLLVPSTVPASHS
jgi:predicted  nucleic acid-binding Zn-ribbon protein